MSLCNTLGHRRCVWKVPLGHHVQPEWYNQVSKGALELILFALLLPWLGARSQASLVAQRLKRLPGMWETWVWSLGWKDPLEKEMATHSSILAWRIPWMEELGGLQSMGSQRVGHNWATSVSLSLSLLLTAICKAYSDSHFAFLHLLFLGMVFIPVFCTTSWTSIFSSSGTLSIRSSPFNLFLTSTV